MNQNPTVYNSYPSCCILLCVYIKDDGLYIERLTVLFGLIPLFRGAFDLANTHFPECA